MDTGYAQRLTCAEARDLLVTLTQEPDAGVDDLALQRHLAGCPRCREHLEILRAFPAAMDAGLEPEPPDDPYVRALDETAAALRARHDLASLFDTIVTRATSLIGVPHGLVYMLDPGDEELVIRNGTGIFEEAVGLRVPVDQSLGGQVIATGMPLAVDDYDTYARRAPLVENGVVGALVGVPLMVDGRAVGVLGVASGSLERVFGAKEIDALCRFARLASIALDNVRLLEKAQHGALYDPTTGLPNRELMRDRISHALSFLRPDDMDPIAVVLLGLDRFGAINESVGHAGGDLLLGAIGRRIATCLRPGDTLARFGGHEFGLILDSVVDAADAVRMTEAIVE